MLSSRSWTSPNTSPAERVQCFGDFVSELLRAQTWRFQRMRREGEIFTFPGQLGSWCRTRITRCHRNGCRNTVVKVHPDSPAVWSPGENFDHFNFVEGMCVAHHYRFLRPVWVPFAVQKNSSNPVDSPVAISWVSVRHPSLADFDTVTMPQQGLDSEWFTLVPKCAKLKHQSWRKLSLCCLSAANWMELLCHFHHLWSFYMKVQCVPYKKTSPNELLVFHDCSVACKSPGWKPLYPCGRIFEIIWTPK